MNWRADLGTLDGMNRVAAPVTPKKRKRSESGAEPGDQGDQALTPTRKRLTPEERVHNTLFVLLLLHMHAYPRRRPTGGSTRTERGREAEEGRREEKEGGGTRAQEEGARREGTAPTTPIADTVKCSAHGNALGPSCAMIESAEGAGEGQERGRTGREEEAQRGRKGQEGRGEEEERGGQEEEGGRGEKEEGGRQAKEGGGQKEERGGEEKEGRRAH